VNIHDQIECLNHPVLSIHLFLRQLSDSSVPKMSDENINNALLKLCLTKPEFFICSFPGKVIIGEPQNLILIGNKSYTIYRCEYPAFFKSLSDIVTLLADEQRKQNKSGVLIQKTVDVLYFWKLENNFIKFGIEDQSNIVIVTPFTESEFVHLIQSFREALLPSLLLNEIETTIFMKLSKLSLKELIEFQHSKTNISKSIEHVMCQSKSPIVVILIQSNLDILIVYHKLESFGANDFVADSIKYITESSTKK